MPWLGFFKKISKSEIFVVLDHTENNPRDAAFWCRRVKICVNGSEHWFSISLKKPENGRISMPISVMSISNTEKDLQRLLNTIFLNYKKAPFFNDIYPLILEYFQEADTNLVKRNMKFIIAAMERLDISTEIIYSSAMQCSGHSNELLIEIIKKLNGSVYICGDGAKGYQDDASFEREGIEIQYNNFVSPVYPQFNSKGFIPGLSIVDMVMNCGWEETKSMLNKAL
jgi:hypothetical protein